MSYRLKDHKAYLFHALTGTSSREAPAFVQDLIAGEVTSEEAGTYLVTRIGTRFVFAGSGAYRREAVFADDSGEGRRVQVVTLSACGWWLMEERDTHHDDTEHRRTYAGTWMAL
jgi:hypothetical protein